MGIHRKIDRTAEDKARIKALRERFQRERPTAEELEANGEYEQTTQGEVLDQMLKESEGNRRG